jgi:hypothetical protein
MDPRSASSQPTFDPNPKERKGEDPEVPDEKVVPERDPARSPNPLKPVPATPDANPIDPRVGQPQR